MRRGLSWALLVAGCATQGPLPTASVRTASRDAFGEHALAADAEGARALGIAAESAHAPGVLRAVQLRVRGLSEDNVAKGQNVSAGLRFMMDRPWTVATLGDSHSAQVEAASALVKAARARARALTCIESARGHAEAERAAFANGYRTHLDELRAWTAAWRTAGTLDPVTAARTELALARRFVELGVHPDSARKHDAVGALLELPAPVDAELDHDVGRIAALVHAEHPAVTAHIASARAAEHVARAESNARIPWLSFMELDYGAGYQGPRDLAARLAVEVPIDDGARGRKERAQFQGSSERLDAQSVALQLAESARAALVVLQAFEREGERLRGLREQAAQAEALALRFMTERQATPDNVAQLLAESHAAKLAVLEAQRTATEAACALEYATGVRSSDWPRVQQSASAP